MKTDALDSQDFYEICQAYRHSIVGADEFAALIAWLRENAVINKVPVNPIYADETPASTTLYGCNNRPPLVAAYQATGGTMMIKTFGQPDCQYTRSELGRNDSKCDGCKHRLDRNTSLM